MSFQNFDMIKGLSSDILQRMAQTKDPMLAPQALAALSWQNKIKQGQPQPQPSQQPTPVRDQVLNQSKTLQNMQQRGAQGIQQLQQGAAQQPMAAGPMTPQPSSQADPYAQGLGATPMQFARGGIVAFAGGEDVSISPLSPAELKKLQEEQARQAAAEYAQANMLSDIPLTPTNSMPNVEGRTFVPPTPTPSDLIPPAMAKQIMAQMAGSQAMPLRGSNPGLSTGLPANLSTAGPQAPRAGGIAALPTNAATNGMSIKEVQDLLKPFTSDASRLINEKPEAFDQAKVFESQEALRKMAGIVGDPYAAQRQRLMDADRQFKDTQPALDKMGLGGIYQYLKGAARSTGQTSMGASVLSGLDAMDNYSAAQRAAALKQTGELNKGLGSLDDNGLAFGQNKVAGVEAIAKAKAAADAAFKQQQVQSAGQTAGHALTGLFTSADREAAEAAATARKQLELKYRAAQAAGDPNKANKLLLDTLKMQVTAAQKNYSDVAKKGLMAEPGELAAATAERNKALAALSMLQKALGMPVEDGAEGAGVAVPAGVKITKTN